MLHQVLVRPKHYGLLRPTALHMHKRDNTAARRAWPVLFAQLQHGFMQSHNAVPEVVVFYHRLFPVQ
jgi:hypothetical protein